MREILSRGKSIDNGEFVHGYLTLSLCRRGGYHHMITVLSEDLEKENLRYIVDKKTIGQFTEQTTAKDKLKIFGGDKVVMFLSELGCGVPEEFEGVVKIIEGQWIVSSPDKEQHRFQWYPLFQGLGWWEITGNIHDE